MPFKEYIKNLVPSESTQEWKLRVHIKPDMIDETNPGNKIEVLQKILTDCFSTLNVNIGYGKIEPYSVCEISLPDPQYETLNVEDYKRWLLEFWKALKREDFLDEAVTSFYLSTLPGPISTPFTYFIRSRSNTHVIQEVAFTDEDIALLNNDDSSSGFEKNYVRFSMEPSHFNVTDSNSLSTLINQAQHGIVYYQGREQKSEKSFLHCLSRFFDADRGKRRAKVYFQALASQSIPDYQKIFYLYALLASNDGPTLKEDVLRELDYEKLDDAIAGVKEHLFAAFAGYKGVDVNTVKTNTIYKDEINEILEKIIHFANNAPKGREAFDLPSIEPSQKPC